MTRSTAAGIERPGGLAAVGFSALLIYAFIVHSRILDFTVPDRHIPKLLYGLVVMTALVSANRLNGVSSKIGVFLMLHIGCIAVAVPFSIWRGGSVEVLLQVLKNFTLFLAITSLTTTLQQCRRLLVTTALAILTVALLSIPFGTMETGRLRLSAGNLSDPNEYALILLLGFTMWTWIVRGTRKYSFRRIVALVAIAALALTFAQTGSRSGIVTLLVVAASLLWRASLAEKVKLILVGLVALTLSSVFLSDYLSRRFVTFFEVDSVGVTDDRTAARIDSAVASTDSRVEVLRQSVRLTWAHPLVGVGPDQFTVYTDGEARARGLRHGSWQVTHNTYTQISSECGIPALLFYVAAIFCSFRVTSSQSRRATLSSHPERMTIRNLALCLRLMVLTIAVFALFLSFAYVALFYIVAGLVVAFDRAALDSLPAAAASAPVAQRTHAISVPIPAVVGSGRRRGR